MDGYYVGVTAIPHIGYNMHRGIFQLWRAWCGTYHIDGHNFQWHLVRLSPKFAQRCWAMQVIAGTLYKSENWKT